MDVTDVHRVVQLLIRRVMDGTVSRPLRGIVCQWVWSFVQVHRATHCVVHGAMCENVRAPVQRTARGLVHDIVQDSMHTKV